MPKGQYEQRDTLVRDENGKLRWEIRHDGELVDSGVFDGVQSFRYICSHRCDGCRVWLGGRELVNFGFIRDTFSDNARD